MSELLALRDIEVVFGAGTPTQTRALRGLDLEIADGDYVTVIGSNGAGKSTMLRVVAGACRPQSGSVRLHGRDVTDWPDHRRARWVAHVFQDPLAGTIPSLTIEENLALALHRGKRRGLAVAVTRERRARFASTLGELGIGLEQRLRERVGLLSGGQRQALALAMATLERPSVLLLDEHTAALDPANHELVMALTDRLVAEHGLTVLMVTHNMRTAIDHGNRLIMLHQGRVALELDGPAKAGTTPEKLVGEFARLRGTALDDRVVLSLAEPT